MSSERTARKYEGTQGGRVDLERRYRQIGISAVAAALRYQSDASHAPVEPQDDQRSVLAINAAA
jgi:hypothetical protein